jgi:uncharacterized membrane protein YfhO
LAVVREVVPPPVIVGRSVVQVVVVVFLATQRPLTDRLVLPVRVIVVVQVFLITTVAGVAARVARVVIPILFTMVPLGVLVAQAALVQRIQVLRGCHLAVRKLAKRGC